MKRTYSLIAVTLSVSLFIYLFYRSEKTVVNELLVMLVPTARFADVRSWISQTIPLSNLAVFSLPGGLWVFCSTVLAGELYLKIGDHKIRMVAVPVLFAVGLEFCQLAGITAGTFDPWDVGFYLIFWLGGYYGFKSRHDQQYILSPFTFKGFACMACFLSVYLAHVNQ